MAFRASIKVCFGDIDYAGIVYYPRFLHYFHVALEDFFSDEIGIDYPTILKKHRIGFPTVHIETDFSSPLSYGDQIEVEISIIKIGNTSITWGYKAFRRGKVEALVVRGQNITVTMNMDTFKKETTPSWLRDLLNTYKNRCA